MRGEAGCDGVLRRRQVPSSLYTIRRGTTIAVCPAGGVCGDDEDLGGVTHGGVCGVCGGRTPKALEGVALGVVWVCGEV